MLAITFFAFVCLIEIKSVTIPIRNGTIITLRLTEVNPVCPNIMRIADPTYKKTYAPNNKNFNCFTCVSFPSTQFVVFILS